MTVLLVLSFISLLLLANKCFIKSFLYISGAETTGISFHNKITQ